MPLDLAQIAAQIEGLAVNLKEQAEEWTARYELALSLLRTADTGSLSPKASVSKTTWLVAGIASGLREHYAAPPCPSEFTVIATDGSHIDVDRHLSVRCSLINVGKVLMRYGAAPDAVLESEASLLFGDELMIAGPAGRQEWLEGALLGVRRSVEELRALVGIAERVPASMPTLALIDGSLILLGLAARDFDGGRSYVREELLDRGFLDALDRMQRTGKDRALALVSYISFPRSTEVVNVLRLALCPHEPADCDRHCAGEGLRQCDAIAGIQDRHLFQAVLGPGERSPVFVSGSRFAGSHYGEHQVHFFYVKVDEEIARVELPQWVAERSELVDLAHCLIVDQCRRGQGYPVALMEAHEKAVVTAADRERFWQLVELSLVEERLAVATSGKRRSKIVRWV
ncbi:MAG: DNA double-strand break repair nuclease NurA [Chloroflexota bacterium]